LLKLTAEKYLYLLKLVYFSVPLDNCTTVVSKFLCSVSCNYSDWATKSVSSYRQTRAIDM